MPGGPVASPRRLRLNSSGKGSKSSPTCSRSRASRASTSASGSSAVSSQSDSSSRAASAVPPLLPEHDQQQVAQGRGLRTGPVQDRPQLPLGLGDPPELDRDLRRVEGRRCRLGCVRRDAGPGVQRGFEPAARRLAASELIGGLGVARPLGGQPGQPLVGRGDQPLLQLLAGRGQVRVEPPIGRSPRRQDA